LDAQPHVCTNGPMAGADSKDVIALGLWEQAARRAARRADPSILRSKPSAVAELSDLEACHVVKALGVDDAPPLLAHFTADQTRALFDLEAWQADRLAPADLLSWLAGFREAGLEPLAAAVRALDAEAVTALWARRLHIAFKPADDTPPEEVPSWLREASDDLEVATTPDQRFLVAPRFEDPDDGAPVEEDERDAVMRLVADLYRDDDWECVAGLLRAAVTDDRFDLEETALRFRSARLEDLGFPPLDRARSIYEPLDRLPDEHEERLVPTDLALAAPYVPAADDGLFFRALSRIVDPKVVSRIESELVPLANAILVAEHQPWSATEAVGAAVARALGSIQVALATSASDDGREVSEQAAAERLTHHALRTLFRLGHTRADRIRRRVLRLRSSRAFALGDSPWALLEAPQRDALEILERTPVELPAVLRAWIDPEARERPLDLEGLAASEPLRSVAEVAAAEAFADHLEAWSVGAEALGLAAGLQGLDHAIWPEAPADRTLRAALGTALAHAWLGGDFAVAPLSTAELRELAQRVTPGGRLPGAEALVEALARRLPAGAAPAVRREARWALERVAGALAPFSGATVRTPDPRFLEGLFVRRDP